MWKARQGRGILASMSGCLSLPHHPQWLLREPHGALMQPHADSSTEHTVRRKAPTVYGT